ncbi:hypothetical protein TCAL_13512 [Tigriopus californicus]|uniref:Large ribosomal subunit protein mL43 n=1 Tax=Tigriopus californicus TaxID=6832 RepID=A0A553PH36_TIGCA|nr:large ribosomal subunit protein mL43-like [Tigriopus californicus]TRY77000.1 hypothetical protein TCAL_13512 [Tigriopus californicus]|eukprot:TCALIF_13512-PA protein Name:"Similar to MRPL43 39S ribosomal protein L43, mitochondrial (Bos taurus)" AED:0.00 eAED:0.00 QI:141/1/0.75/1/0.66/0.75/4/1391/178
MTSRCLFLKHGFIFNNAPLKNGLGRFIPQLQRVTIKFCKESGGSVGIRQFIEKEVVEFAQKNPHVSLYLKPRRHRDPFIVAEYLNGEKHHFPLKNKDFTYVVETVDSLLHHSGKEFQIQEKQHYTDQTSIQGMWHPFTHVDPSVAVSQFPNDQFSTPFGVPMTATEKLKELFEAQKKA